MIKSWDLSSTQRSSYEWHSDWVNDVVLCNQNRNLVSCSSDRTVCLFNVSESVRPTRLGFHSDYAKRLAHPSAHNWVASGGLDRKILIWDIAEARPNEPTVLFIDESPSGSIYALATNQTGSIVVSGSSQKYMNVFDVRTKTVVQKLAGHLDTVRDILVSEDGMWVLSGSSDTTIKLWSLAMPDQCVATYTHCSSSVWCLATNSSDLSTFWAGTKDGYVYKMNINKLEEDHVIICKEDQAVLKIGALENEFIWTATTSSSIKRYKDTAISNVENKAHFVEPDGRMDGVPGIKKSLLLNNKRHVVSQDTEQMVCIWDIIKCVKVKEFGKAEFDDVCKAENSPEWVSNWCTIDTKLGNITVHLEEGKCLDSEIYAQDISLEAKSEDQRINLARWTLTNLLYRYSLKCYPDNISFRVDESRESPKVVVKIAEKGGSKESMVTPKSASFLNKLKYRLRTKSNDEENSSSIVVEEAPKRVEETERPLINFEETPYISLDQSINMVFSIEDPPSMFEDTYRGKLCDLGPSMSDFIPHWVKSWIIDGSTPVKEQAKLTFTLLRHPKSALPEMPQEYHIFNI